MIHWKTKAISLSAVAMLGAIASVGGGFSFNSIGPILSSLGLEL